jgi:dihydrofolate reductase
MRKYVVSMIVSVDGYHEGPGKDVMAMPIDDGFSRHNVELLREAGTLLHGSRFFDGGEYWTRVAADETQPAIEREIGEINNRTEHVVISDSLQPDPSWPWADLTRIVPVADAKDEVAALKRGEGGDILTFGSVTTWSPLLAAGLVDELRLTIVPAIAGTGRRLLDGLPAQRLETIRSTTSPTGKVLVDYRVVREPAGQG